MNGNGMIDRTKLNTGLAAALIIVTVGSLWTFTATRASEDDVAAVIETHNKDIAEINAEVRAIKHAVNRSAATTSAIAQAVNRMDIRDGGPGLPESTLVVDPVD